MQPFFEIAIGTPLVIITVFLAIRLWSYAYFKSKYEQFTKRVNEIGRRIH